jgi:superfamily I DNA/RNA helicase
MTQSPPTTRHDHPTSEQESVISAAVQGYNVRVLAVPGAGKTFTLEHMSAKLRSMHKRVLCLTYSSRLKTEWRDANSSHREDIHSFHSLACILYPEIRVRNDDDLAMVLQMQFPPPGYNPIIYDVILIDETQDMCLRHYSLLKTHYRAVQLVVVGQLRQCVYDYADTEDLRADTSYLDRPSTMMKS